MPRHSHRSVHPVDTFEASFDAQVHELSAQRRDFVGWVHDAVADDEVVDDLEIVFSEVASNAVAASPSASDDVRVHAEVDDDVLLLEISNRAACPDELPAPVLNRGVTLRQRGRGLLIARAYMDTVRMGPLLPDRFVVRCYRRLSPRG